MFEENVNNNNNSNENNPFKNISNKFSSHHQSKDFDLLNNNNNNINNIERNSTPNFNNNNNNNYYYYNINNNISEYNKDFLRKSEIYNNNNNNSFNSLSNRAYQITDNIKTKSKETLNKIGSKLNQTISNFPNISNISSKIKNNFKNNNNNNKINKDDSLFSNNNNNNNNNLDSRASFAGNFGINTNSLPHNLIQNKSEIHINKFNISVNISNFETKSSSNEEIIYYQIDLYSNLSKKEWSIFHKFNDFYEMNLIFKKYFTKAPNFPNNSLIKISDLSEIIHRKEALNTYLKEVCDRPDLFTSIYCVKFLKLENHYPDIELFYPLELYNFNNELILPISVSYFLNHANLLFIGCGKSKNFFFESFINKVKNLNPFHNNNNNDKKIVKGQFAILNIIKNYQNNIHIEPLFAKPLFSEVTAINFFKNKNCLTVGCNDGTLIVYKIYINESSKESQGQFIIEAGTINVNKSIIGTIINFNIGYIYIFTNDCYVKVYTLNYLTYVKEYLITLKNLICFKFDEINFHAICGDENGNIYIYDLKCENNNSNEIYKPIQLLNYVSGMNLIITCFYLNVDNDILIAAFKGGNVLFYKMKFNGNVNIDCIKKMEIDKNVDVTEIVITEKGEMIFALSNGSAVIYYNSDQIPEFTVDAHLKSISNMFYVEEKKSLITCSEDKTIKILQLPVYYPDKMLMKEDKYNEEFNKNNIIENEDKKINNSINKLFGNNDDFNNNNNNDDDEYYENDDNNNNNNIFKDNNNNNNINNNNKINKYLEKNIFEDKYYDKIVMNKRINNNDNNNNNENEYKNFKIFSEDLDGWSPILIDYVE